MLHVQSVLILLFPLYVATLYLGTIFQFNSENDKKNQLNVHQMEAYGVIILSLEAFIKV